MFSLVSSVKHSLPFYRSNKPTFSGLLLQSNSVSVLKLVLVWAEVDLWWSFQGFNFMYSHAYQVSRTKTALRCFSRSYRSNKIYLKVFVDEGLPVRLDLPELWPQPFDLALHPHDVLKVPLRAQVQHLDWLWHVLYLLKRIRRCSIDFPVHRQIKMSFFFSCLVPCFTLLSPETKRNKTTPWPPVWLPFNKLAGCISFKSTISIRFTYTV